MYNPKKYLSFMYIQKKIKREIPSLPGYANYISQ